MTKEGIGSMTTRISNGISKEAGKNVENVWAAVNRAKLEGADNVRFEGKDYAILYRYMKACAKAAGLVALLIAAGCKTKLLDGYRGRVVKIVDETSPDKLSNERDYFYTLEVGCNKTRHFYSSDELKMDEVVCVTFGSRYSPGERLRCPRNLRPFPRWKVMPFDRTQTGVAVNNCVELPQNG